MESSLCNVGHFPVCSGKGRRSEGLAPHYTTCPPLPPPSSTHTDTQGLSRCVKHRFQGLVSQEKAG